MKLARKENCCKIIYVHNVWRLQNRYTYDIVHVRTYMFISTMCNVENGEKESHKIFTCLLLQLLNKSYIPVKSCSLVRFIEVEPSLQLAYTRHWYSVNEYK